MEYYFRINPCAGPNSATGTRVRIASPTLQPILVLVPFAKDIDDFVFDDTPINETLVRDFVGGEFLAHERNVVLIGGTGNRPKAQTSHAPRN